MAYEWQSGLGWSCHKCGTHHANENCVRCRLCQMPRAQGPVPKVIEPRKKAPWVKREREDGDGKKTK
eukprot:13360172-Alexandrium_andersonii.AAC.1